MIPIMRGYVTQSSKRKVLPITHFFKFLSVVFCLFLNLYLNAENEESVGEILKSAEELFDAALYEKAIEAYDKALQKLENHSFNDVSEIIFGKAKAHLLNGNFLEMISLLENQTNYQNQYLFFIGIAYNSINQYEKAIKSLEEYLRSSEDSSLPYQNEVKFELGLANFYLKKSKEARSYFAAVASNQQNQLLFYLSQLYLARIELLEGNFTQAGKILDNLNPILASHDLLKFELFYLRGETFFQLGDYFKAANFFEQALPSQNQEYTAWCQETLYHLGWCYLKIADSPLKNKTTQKSYFDKAEEIFIKLSELSEEEDSHLALSQLYLARANRLNENEAFEKAEGILSKKDTFTSREAQTQVLLLRAQAGPNYLLRDKLYRQLTHDFNNKSPVYAMGWYLRGLNDFEEGHALKILNHSDEAKKAFERAAFSLHKAFELFKDIEPSRAGLALKYFAQANQMLDTVEGKKVALSTLDNLLKGSSDLLRNMSDADEIFYLHALFALELKEIEQEEKFAQIAEDSLEAGLASYPNGKFADALLYLKGISLYRKEHLQEAMQIFIQLAESYPTSPYAGEALFWASRCAESLQEKPEKVRQYRQKVFESYPNSLFAAEAYFTLYSYRDYLQGDRAAIKHLQAFQKKFPQTSFLLNAFYLIGLDQKRDRRTPEGKWISKKNLKASIDAFHEVETIFDSLYNEGLLSSDLEYFLTIRYRSTLERALANLAIAEESQGAKRQIYLEYAEEVFQKIYNDFENSENNLTKHLIGKDPISPLQEEAGYWLALTFIKSQKDDAAEKILSEMLEKYRSAKITRGYFLSQVWYEQGLIAVRRNEHAIALQCFLHAEDASKGKVLNTDQKLDLWIQQSLCYRSLNQFDKAILILSKVINDDAISSLRIKAMLLRAETYELQGRPELARKQLEATSKKGGEWALKAKAKLEKEYGY